MRLWGGPRIRATDGTWKLLPTAEALVASSGKQFTIELGMRCVEALAPRGEIIFGKAIFLCAWTRIADEREAGASSRLVSATPALQANSFFLLGVFIFWNLDAGTQTREPGCAEPRSCKA